MEHYKLEHRHDVAVLKFVREHVVDLKESDALSAAVMGYIDMERPKKLIVDFQEVRRVPSETINMLLQVRKRMQRYQGQLRLCSMTSEVRDVFKTMCLEGTIFKIAENLDGAMGTLGEVAATGR